MNTEKTRLRSLIIKNKINIPPDVKNNCDRLISEKLINLDEFIKSDCILTYVSTKIEVDTYGIIEYALSVGKTVAVPRCEHDTNKMRFYRIKSLDNLVKGYFNIPEPDRFCSEQIDYNNALCIVPGLAFNKDGYRIGYGRGYFDRFLAENNVKSVGLCYKAFVIDDLPVEGFDIPVDILLTD